MDQLPEPVRAGRGAFTAATRQVFADDLVSVVLFGSAAEARLRKIADAAGRGSGRAARGTGTGGWRRRCGGAGGDHTSTRARQRIGGGRRDGAARRAFVVQPFFMVDRLRVVALNADAYWLRA